MVVCSESMENAFVFMFVFRHGNNKCHCDADGGDNVHRNVDEGKRKCMSKSRKDSGHSLHVISFR